MFCFLEGGAVFFSTGPANMYGVIKDLIRTGSQIKKKEK